MTPTKASTILIVDDEIQNRKLLVTLLLPHGYNTLTAASGEEALAQIEKCKPDLILLDVMMPGMDGFQLAAMLKGSLATSDIPIIMVTALPDRGARMAGLSAGAEDFLTKPVDRIELSLRVRNLLRLKVLGNSQKQAQAEILVLNSELEERVLERTEQLHQANQELEAFSYSVAHDLRGPLTSIAGFSGALAKEIAGTNPNERTRHFLARIQAGVLQMGNLIDALLSLAQVWRKPMRRESVDLSALAELAIGVCRESQPQQSAQVDIESGLTVLGDPALLGVVLENLLGNAWKFSSGRKDARIVFKREKFTDVAEVFSVRDNGAGFDMTYSDKLFVAFQRLHSASEFSGMGIGLATVRKVIARHGGKIWAESTPGHGAAFYFTLHSEPVS